MSADELRWVGKRVAAPRRPALLAGRGELHRRRQAARHAARRRPAQPARPRPHPRDRRQRGRARCPASSRPHRRRGPRARRADARVLRRAGVQTRHRDRKGALRRRGRRGRRGRPTATSPRTPCELIEVEYEPLLRVIDPYAAHAARRAAAARHARSNVVFERTLDFGDVDGDFAARPSRASARLRWHRMGAQPIETAGAVASYDPFTRRHDRLVEHQHVQLHALGLRRIAQGARPTAEAGPVPGRRQLRQQAPDHPSASPSRARSPRPPAGRCKFVEDRVDNLAANDNVGPDRSTTPSWRWPRMATFLGLRLEDRRRLRRLLPVRPWPARQRAVPTDRAVPHRQPRVRRQVRADQQGPAGLLPRRGRRSRQLRPRTSGRRGRRRARHRPRGDPAPELHPARRVPVQDPYRQHVRQRQLRPRARPRAGDRDLPWLAEQERLRAEGRYIGIGLASCQERSAYSATEWWFWYDKPPLPRPRPPRASSCRSTRWAALWPRWAARSGATARRPSSARWSPRSSASTRPAVAINYADSTVRARCRPGPAAAA